MLRVPTRKVQGCLATTEAAGLLPTYERGRHTLTLIRGTNAPTTAGLPVS